MGGQNKQRGYGVLEVVLVVAAVAVLGAAGWVVYQHNRLQVSGATGNHNPTSGNQATTTTTTTTNQTVVQVPELGIQITVPNDIKDLTYKVINTGTFKNGQSGLDAGFSSTNLAAIDAKCAASAAPLGYLTKGNGQYPTSDPAAASNYGGTLVKQFSTFFISYTGPQGGCSTNSSALANMNKFAQEFKTALSTVQALN